MKSNYKSLFGELIFAVEVIQVTCTATRYSVLNDVSLTDRPISKWSGITSLLPSSWHPADTRVRHVYDIYDI